jgi:HEPN domain-containing protein
LSLAEEGLKIPGVYLEDLCFNAQQAAEKALKAVCVHQNLDFPRTHSLVRLLDILDLGGVNVPPEAKMVDILTQYAVQTRYPGFTEEITITEYQEALELARLIVSWSEQFLK